MTPPPISINYNWQEDLIINRHLNIWAEFGLDFPTTLSNCILPNYELNMDSTHNSVTLPFYSQDWYLSPNLRVIDFYGAQEFPPNLFPRYKKRSLSSPLRFERRSIYEPTIIAIKNAFNETIFYALPLSSSIDYLTLIIELLSHGIKNAKTVLHYLFFGMSYQNSYFSKNRKQEFEDKGQKYETKSSIANIAKHFIELDDPRRDQTKHHNLLDIIVIAICAIICGANHWTEMEIFGQAKHKWFKSFLELPNGIPSHDTFRRVFTLMDPEQFKKCFLSWVQSISQITEGEVIAIDGKQLRRSHDKASGKKAIHMVSAWATKNHLVLGQEKVDEKSNEITAIPRLLEVLEISGCIITIDAMGCQKEIAKQIRTKTGDYVLALKGNHKNLFNDVKNVFKKSFDKSLREINVSYDKTSEVSHGRREIRECWTISVEDITDLLRSKGWTDLKTIVCIKSERVLKNKKEEETRYFISSLESNAKKHLQAVRSHWGIENSLHWVLDMSFREDESRVRTGNSPENFAILRHFALNFLKQEKSQNCGIESKRKKAGWDEDYLLKILSL